MGISRVVVNELRRELADLRHQQARAAAKIQGIRLILSGVAPADDGGIEHQARPMRQRAAQRPRRRGNLRRKLTEVLQQAPGAKAKDITAQLERDGFRVGGMTSLPDRVSHELSRLRRKGLVKTDHQRNYLLANDRPVENAIQSA